MADARRSPGQDLRRLQQIAATRAGVVGSQDLRSCGFSPDATLRRIDAGIWQRIGSAVLLPNALQLPNAPQLANALQLAGAPKLSGAPRIPSTRHRTSSASHPHREDLREIDDLRWAWILQFTFGPTAAISGALALRHAGWCLPDASFIIVVPEKPRAHIDGVRILRRDVSANISNTNELHYLGAPEAFLDTIVTMSPMRRDEFVDAALQQRLVNAHEFERWIQPRLGKGHTGARALRYALLRMSTGSRSEAEQRMATLLKHSRTGRWQPNYPLVDASGHTIAEIDFALVDARIAIEVDGRAHHTDRRAFERDRQRQNHLVLGGWLVLRFTWEQITGRPAEVVTAITAAVARCAA